MNTILFDDQSRENLLPLTFTRPVAGLRVGILTITEKWEYYLQTSCSYLTEAYLQNRFKLVHTNLNLYINGSVLPDKNIVARIQSLKQGEALTTAKGVLIAVVGGSASSLTELQAMQTNTKVYEGSVEQISYPWDIFSKNGEAIRHDFGLLTQGRKSAPISQTNQIAGAENIFIEEGASIEFSIINAQTGPVYIGKDASIMEGCIVRGPLALCEHAELKMGAKIYGPTTLGPYCKVGGEVNNSVLQGFSSKAHDGFLGNSVLGEWCNLGADTNNSNLKNNYAEVRVWSYGTQRFAPTGLQFCGLIMGDHSKSGINTMFNTGTVIGVSANVFGAGFPRNFIPSFAWGGAGGMVEYKINKANEVAKLVMQRRNRSEEFMQQELDILAHVYSHTDRYRQF